MRRLTALLVSLSALAAGLLAHPESEVAIAELSRLIERTPLQPSLWFARSARYLEHGRWLEAEADLVETERLSPGFPGLNLAFAQVLLERGRYASARERALLVLSQESENAAAHLLSARASAKLGDAKAAAMGFSRAIALLAEPAPELFLERANLNLPVKVRLEGLEEGLSRIGPAHVLLVRALDLELSAGRIDDALRRIDRIVAQSERNATWLKRRGDILVTAGRIREARTAYEQAKASLAVLPDWLKQSPETTLCLNDLAQALNQLPPAPPP
ncbi:MAG: tetratricopeptide repeat protein [Opitutaceae bacterium]|nr:tetratricopeptide repeat protein [Opitutaceae bacterium]